MTPTTGRGPSPGWGPASSWGRTAAGDWTLEGVRRFLADYGRISTGLTVSPLPGGWENLNLRIDAGDERFVLRRYDSTAPAEVPWEIELLRYLVERGFPTPALVPRSDGGLLGAFGGRPAALFAFVEGRHPRWDEPAAGTAAAEVIAELHRVTARLVLPFPRTRQGHAARFQRFLEWAAVRREVAEEAGMRRLVDEVTYYGREFDARLEQVQARTGALPRGVVHTDAHSNNLLVDADGRLLALLDFDDAHEALLLKDVCMLVDTWGVERDEYQFEAPRARRVLACYAGRRPLIASEQDFLPDALALFNLAEATSYVMGRVEEGTPADTAIGDCGQYALFRGRTALDGWRDRLRDALLA